MKRTPLVLALIAAAAALLAAGCGKDDAIPASAGAPTTSTSADDSTSSSTGDSTTTTAAAEEGDSGPSDTEAAEVRADLAALLEEHTYLAGITISRLVAEGASGPNATAAAAALDANSNALGDAVSSGFDPEVGEDFLRLWRGHITNYVSYANDALDTFAADTGDLFETASEEAVSADEVQEGLRTHVESTLAAIDATVSGSPDAVTLLREAASHAPDGAAVWARAMTAGDEA
jgi:hypothetical protein